jgi:hypothetical protein
LETIRSIDDAGRVIPIPVPMDQRFRNAPWPAAMESAFMDRVQRAMEASKPAKAFKGSTYFENEKHWYGHAMGHLFKGTAADGLKALQAEDHQRGEWHKHTLGIDLYACFTIKHQMRK